MASVLDLQAADHLWIWDNFCKTQPHAVLEPQVQAVLSRYLLGRKPFIQHSPNGKPQVLMPDGMPLHISLSHSKDTLVLALSLACSLGVDVEHIKPRKNIQKIAGRYFSKLENVASLDDFYRSWTIREAFIKAMGGRLFDNLADIHLLESGSSIAVGLGGEITHSALSHKLAKDYMLALCRPVDAQKEVWQMSTTDL